MKEKTHIVKFSNIAGKDKVLRENLPIRIKTIKSIIIGIQMTGITGSPSAKYYQVGRATCSFQSENTPAIIDKPIFYQWRTGVFGKSINNKSGFKVNEKIKPNTNLVLKWVEDYSSGFSTILGSYNYHVKVIIKYI